MNGLKLAAIASALLGCASAEQPADSNKSEMMHHDMTMPHVVSIVSKRDFAATLDSARMAVEKRGFKTFAVIDHAQGARSIGADLRPTTLIVFGNPNGGTPLMQAEQRLGLELPLKLLVLEDETGAVRIVHEDIDHLFHEYGISSLEGPQEKIKGVLNAIAGEAAGG